MRLTIFALFLSAGTSALCQSAAPANPSPRSLTAPQWAQPDSGFSIQPRESHLNPDLQQKTIILPAPAPMQKQQTAQLDPKIIVHPPQSSLGEQPLATQIAQNLYPGLTMLPINEWKGNAHQIPIEWPNLKVQNIPTAWPKVEIKSVETGAATNPARK